jgi:raffinose/stachyose/melibiose transport system permease protein
VKNHGEARGDAIRKIAGWKRRVELGGFIGPAVFLFALFVVYPIIYLVYGSFFSWSGVGTMEWIGWANYARLAGDWIFRLALRNEVLWALFTIFPQMFLGFILAVCLNRPLFGRNIYRAILYMPAVISPVVIGIIWQSIYDPYMGPLADFLRSVGLGSWVRAWLAEPQTALFAIIAVNVWKWTGWSMIMYLAGLQGIPEEVYEAATIDGVNVFQRVTKIMWPMCRGTTLTLILLGVIGTLQEFALVYVLTKGGPNHASELLTTHIFNEAFTLRNMGYASAISVVLLIIGVVMSMLQLRYTGSGKTARGVL